MSEGVSPAGFGFTPIGKIKAKRLRWLIETIIPAGTLVFISAQAKQGKSLLAIYVSLCLTTARSFLGQFKTRRAKVLYYSLEDHMGELKSRVKHLLQSVQVKRFPRYLLISNAIGVSLPADVPQIEADIRVSKANIVIIDTLRRAHELDEDSSTHMAPVFKELRRLVREYQVTIIVVHHAGHKIKNRENPGDWLRGSSDLNASWEVLIGLERVGSRVTARVFHKYRSSLKFFYETIRGQQVDKHTGDYPVIDLRPKSSSQFVEDMQLVVAALGDGPLSGNELEEKLKGKVSRPRIDGTLKWLVEGDQIRQSGQGRNTKWGLDSSNSVDGRKE